MSRAPICPRNQLHSRQGIARRTSVKAVTGADLSWTNLRYLRGFRAFIAKADLNSSDLTGAVIAFSDLRGADFDDSQLYDADLESARISSDANPTVFL